MMIYYVTKYSKIFAEYILEVSWESFNNIVKIT